MWEALIEEYELMCNPRRLALFYAILCYYRMPRFRVRVLLRWLVSTKSEVRKNKLSKKLMLKYGIEIGIKCKIGRNLNIMHYNGIVIGINAVIGDNCSIYQQVTIGQKNGKYPVIGNNVIIYPGAKILGGIKIGNNSIIAANSVVLNDVKNNEIVAGIPAKKIN